MCRDTFRFCLNCQDMRRFHKSWGFGHSRCKKCGFPSLWAVKCPAGKARPDDLEIEQRKEELGYMMAGPRISGEVYV